jgi:tRNA dimethylallyltransferase
MTAAQLAIVGPTGAGKSDVAMALAAHRGWDIVAVDAMQVYRGMDVGTGKPSAADRARVRHHCLDLVDPTEPFTMAQWELAYRTSVDDSTPHLLVAGTGLYLRAAIDSMCLPGQWPELRAQLEAQFADGGANELYLQLTALDPLAASRIEPGNGRRVVRALEVCFGSGRPFSSFGDGLAAYGESQVAQVGLRWSRPLLAERIERRVQSMLEAGWLDEVRALRERGPLSRTAEQALGYRELGDHLAGRCSMSAAIEQTVLRTRQYAVRQERWFRRDPRIAWVDIVHDPVAEVLQALDSSVERPRPTGNPLQ